MKRAGGSFVVAMRLRDLQNEQGGVPSSSAHVIARQAFTDSAEHLDRAIRNRNFTSSVFTRL